MDARCSGAKTVETLDATSLPDEIQDCQPTCLRIVGWITIRLKMKIWIRDRITSAIREPNVPRGRGIECADDFEHERVARAPIGLTPRELLFDDSRGIGAGGDAYADAFLWLPAAAHGAFDLRAARMTAIQIRAIRIPAWNGCWRRGGRWRRGARRRT